MQGLIYCRYSDDIIIFSKSKDILDSVKVRLLQRLDDFHLQVNPKKVCETSPWQPWTFLGFECDGRDIDIDIDIDVCEVSVRKLKAKMRCKARVLRRWRENNGKEGWMAARAFIKHSNKKLFTSENKREVNWSWWYFPLITTDKSLRELDSYMQDCVRYVATGTRTKSRFDFRYEQMKDLGYGTLVNEWYRCKETVSEYTVR